MNPFFDGETLLKQLQVFYAWLFNDVLTPINVAYTAMQVPAVVATGFAAWWVYDFIIPVVAARIERKTLRDYPREVMLTLATLVFPLLWLSGLLLAGAVSSYFEWPQYLVRIAANLLGAWIFIRLASLLVRDPLWSRVVVVVAFTVAGLNILDLLYPSMAFLDRFAIETGQLRISLLTVVKGVLSLAVLLWVAVLVSRILETRIQQVSNLTPSVQVLLGKLFKATLIAFAILISLTSIGVDFTALAVFSGAVGVGIGFGLQKIVSNLISGIILLMDKSIKPGDIIQIGDTYGWVESLGARYVSVETRDGTEYLIPNEDIITHQVVNWSHRNYLARIRVPVRISYKSDVRMALSLMRDAAAIPSRVLTQPPPNALLIGFGDSALDLEIRFWIEDVRNGVRNISSEVLLEVWDAFRIHGIAVPFPQRDVHIHNTPAGPVSGEPSVEPLPPQPAE